MRFSWLWLVAVAAAGFYAGRNYVTAKAVVDNRTKIEGASDVVTGLGKIFG